MTATQVEEYTGTRLNDILYLRLRAGDTTVRVPLIENNLALVERRVRGFLRRRKIEGKAPQWYDDLVGAGNLSLVRAVDEVISKGKLDDDNITAYLSRA